MKRICAPLALLAAALMGTLAPSAAADTSSAPLPGWIIDGAVHAIERVDSAVYLGGSFGRIGPRTGPGVPLSAASGEPVGPFPEIGRGGGLPPFVTAVVSDGSGGWFVGGTFLSVGGVPRERIAHIRADGVLDPNFAPTANFAVDSMERVGDVLYLAGDFSEISGVTRPQLAAVSASTGDLLDWNPAPRHDVYSHAGVDDIEATPSTVYVAGEFDAIGGAERHNLAAIDAATGQATSFRADAESRVDRLALADGTLYMGGGVYSVAGQRREGMAAVDATTGTLKPWDPAPKPAGGCCGLIAAIEPAGEVIYVGGNFTAIGGAPRNAVAAVDTATGKATSWDAGLDSRARVNDIDAAGDVVYLAGEFEAFRARARHTGLAALDRLTASATAVPWQPETDGPGDVVEVAGGVVFAGGRFRSANLVHRGPLVAFDARSGIPTDWTADVQLGQGSGVVRDLEAHGGVLYLSGRFDGVNGKARKDLAAVEADSGDVAPWEPNAPESGHAFTRIFGASESGVLIGGTEFEEPPRETLALADPVSGEPEQLEVPRAPSAAILAGDQIYMAFSDDLARDGSIVEARRIGAAAPCWRVSVDGAPDERAGHGVWSLAVGESELYLGGGFSEVAGGTRENLAALDAVDGHLLPAVDQAFDTIAVVAVAADSVYVAGEGATLVELRRGDGQPTSFAPRLSGNTAFMYGIPPFVHDIEPAPDGLLHLGGSFDGAAEVNVRGYAAFPGATAGWSAPEPTCDDVLRPSLGIALRRRGLRRALRHGMPVVARTDEPGRLALSARVPARYAKRHNLKRQRVARRNVELEGGRTTVRLRLARRARTAISGASRLPLMVEAVVTDGAGNRSPRVRKQRVFRRR